MIGHSGVANIWNQFGIGGSQNAPHAAAQHQVAIHGVAAVDIAQSATGSLQILFRWIRQSLPKILVGGPPRMAAERSNKLRSIKSMACLENVSSVCRFNRNSP